MFSLIQFHRVLLEYPIYLNFTAAIRSSVFISSFPNSFSVDCVEEECLFPFFRSNYSSFCVHLRARCTRKEHLVIFAYVVYFPSLEFELTARMWGSGMRVESSLCRHFFCVTFGCSPALGTSKRCLIDFVRHGAVIKFHLKLPCVDARPVDPVEI